MNTTEIKLNTDASVIDEIDRLAKEKDAWLDRLMKFYLPPKLYEAGRQFKRPKAIQRWLAKEKFHVREVPTKYLTQFCKGKQVLAEFKLEGK